MNSMMRGLTAIGVVAAALSVQSIAHAGVSNPDYYFIDVPSGLDSIYDGGTGVINLNGQLEGDLDSLGVWTFGGASFSSTVTNVTVSGNPVSAQPIVVASGTSGTIDPGNTVIRLTLRMRLKFTGTGLGSSCQTALFTVALSNAKTFLGGSGAYNVGTGQFKAGAQDFSIPALSGNCGGFETTLNTAFGFNNTSGTIAMKFDTGSITNPQIPSP